MAGWCGELGFHDAPPSGYTRNQVRYKHISMWKKIRRLGFPSGRQFSFFFFQKSYFYFIQLPPSQKKEEITMEKTEHTGSGGGVHVSVINTFWSLTPRVALSAKRRNIPRLVSINYCQIPNGPRSVPTATCTFPSSVVLSDGAVWDAMNVESRINTRLTCNSNKGGCSAGLGSSEEMPIFMPPPLSPNKGSCSSTPGPYSCALWSLFLFPFLSPFWSQISINHSSNSSGPASETLSFQLQRCGNDMAK